jgi:MFS family permease
MACDFSRMTPFSETRMRRNVWLLFACQALMNASVVGQVVMSALIGHSLAEDKSLATLPMAIQFVATMAASIPAGIVFARLGRRAGFLLGAAGALLGSLVFAWGVWRADFWLYTLGGLPAGLGFGIAQHYRFAAAEVASAAYRPRAIALVMAGGVVSALFGPEIVKHTKDLFGPALFLGTYLALAVLPVLCAVLLTIVDLPPAPPRVSGPTPIAEIIARPTFITAAVSGLIAYGTMNLVMTSTPVEMMLCGFGVNEGATVIQAHAVAMFAPGFVTGRLIQRFGVHRIIAAGGLLTAACAAVAIAGNGWWFFFWALVLLGVGWNFMFTGATTLLAQSHSANERIRAQTANDLIVFGTVAATALSSGAVHHWGGWWALNAAIVPPVLVALALLAWHAARRQGAAAAA